MTTQAMNTPKSDLLRNTLKANAVFCLTSGLLMAIAAKMIADVLGIKEATTIANTSGRTFIRVIGIGLISYAIILFAIIRQRVIGSDQAWMAIIGDILWVIGSIALILSNWLPFTTHGQWAVLIVADIVLLFGILQYWGLRQQNR